MSDTAFIIARPRFDIESGSAEFTYRLGDLSFTEALQFPGGFDRDAAQSPVFVHLLDLTAAVLGVSYYKLRAPFEIDATALSLAADDRSFLLDIYENGLGEFYARNDLKRFGKLNIAVSATSVTVEKPDLADRALVLIGGGKDSLVSVDLLERAGIAMTLFAVNPKGPILSSAERAAHDMIGVRRVLDPEMIRLGKEPGFYNGHVPSTAINSMIASLASLLFGYNRIVLSNERSASEGNIEFDGREANHQHSKSLEFERHIQSLLYRVSGGAIEYFSLLRPYSEARIARLFARGTRFDDVFSSCNRNFLQAGNSGPLWCGKCPKCLFVFLIFAPEMGIERLTKIFDTNVLDNPDNIAPYRELVGIVGHKPWECVGEILEAAACLWKISDHPDWRNTAVVQALRDDLIAFYSQAKLQTAYADLFVDSDQHLIPAQIEKAVFPHAN
ncbi:hypothetical protein [Pelagibacterium lentulum]|uniref:UDP-N-acetyl-alpha-D-muramoyl-L-alanyl-L-glutamate epimerase n=1 Tax=Pelagibacterium lentulum TaxID=2029865 RepID=A0A916VWF4_9HYPH|nr:hypothetical protein [Pelagibacterium lentulum]GGA44942.1 hypothetical protein GCM10011499_13290 [Pelagibacterium lentulum]